MPQGIERRRKLEIIDPVFGERTRQGDSLVRAFEGRAIREQRQSFRAEQVSGQLALRLTARDHNRTAEVTIDGQAEAYSYPAGDSGIVMFDKEPGILLARTLAYGRPVEIE